MSIFTFSKEEKIFILEDFYSKRILEVIGERKLKGISFRRIIIRDDFSIIALFVEGDLVFENVEVHGIFYIRDTDVSGKIIFLDCSFEKIILSRVKAGNGISISSSLKQEIILDEELEEISI
ncbi:MAG: hypothetical protein PHH17_00780 [Candidatus Pacebacteria bacterium]|nr:hypothetical protein [Candidatus Paceibacterota bacterium]MDD3728702.1 hypothetical protein [Candidatus Paceibacterota bacterium]MDD4201440.1 hypothetical protein [Candidatus Paceibacterota bacterium]MDD5445734.1 hypothetical protein [Candidatus Paceibacterota bacterium]